MRRRILAGILAGLLVLTQAGPLYAAEDAAVRIEEEEYPADDGAVISYEEDASYEEVASYEESGDADNAYIEEEESGDAEDVYTDGEASAEEEDAYTDGEASSEEEDPYTEEAVPVDAEDTYIEEEAPAETESAYIDETVPDEEERADTDEAISDVMSAEEAAAFAGVSEPWVEPTQSQLEEDRQFNSSCEVGSCTTTYANLPFKAENGDQWYYNNYSVRFFYDPEVVIVTDEAGQVIGNYDEAGEYIDSEASHFEERDSQGGFGIWRIGTGSCNVVMKVLPEPAKPGGRYDGWDLNWVNKYTWDDAPFVTYHYDAIEEYSLEFDDTDGRLYTDEIRTLSYRTDGLRDSQCVLHATVGVWNGEEFEDIFGEGDGWSAELDRNGGTIVLDGTTMKAKGVERIFVKLSAGVEAGGVPVRDEIAADWRSFEICDPRVEYNWNCGDRDLLPGWTDFVDRIQRCKVENAEYPDGEDFDVIITDISLRDVEGSGVMAIEAENEDGWKLRAENAGVAELTVTYKDWDDTENCTETFAYYVGSDVYDCWFDPDSGSWTLMPGKSLSLTAGASHAVHDPVRHEDHWLSDEEMEGVSFEWSIDENSLPEDWRGLITLTPDGKTAVLSAAGLPEGWNKEDEINVRVELVFYEGTDGEGQPVEKARTDRWFRISGDYAEVWLIDENGQASRYLDSRMPLGSPVTVTPELRYYDLDNPDAYTTAPVLHARWYYDENCVTITDENGEQVGNNNGQGEYQDSGASTGASPRFTITRKGDWWTNISLDVDIPDGDGLRQITHDEFQLDEVHCDIWFEEDGSVCADGAADFRVNLDNTAGTGYEVRATAGVWEDDGFVSTVPEGDGWSLNREKGILQIDGAVMKNKQIGRLEVKIEVVSGDFVLSEDQRGFEIRDPEYQHDFYEEMFPGDTRFWQADDGGQRMRVFDARFPEEQFQRYRITAVSAECEEDPYDTRDAVTVEAKDGGFELSAVRPGEARLLVTVEIFHEDGRSETVKLEGNVWVSDFRVYMDLLSSNGGYSTNPGTPVTYTVSLSAEEQDSRTGERHMVDTSDWHVAFEVETGWIDQEWIDEHADGDYNAAAERGRLWDYAVGADGRSVTVTTEADAPNMDIRVIARAYDHNEEMEWEVKSTERWLNISSTTWQIETGDSWDQTIPPGASAPLAVVLKRYDKEHPEGVEVSDVDWEVDWYEGDGDIDGDDIPHLIVTDADGRTLTHEEDGGTFGKAPFTVKRVAPWEVRFRVIASWTDDEDFRVTDREFILKDANYDMQFVSGLGRGDGGHTWFYEGETVSVTPDLGGIQDLIRAGYPVEIEASYEGAGISLTEAEFSADGILNITGEERYNEIRDHLNEEGDGRLILHLQAKLNGITLSHTEFVVLFFHTCREMEDDDVRILTGEVCHYDDSLARFYVEDAEHCSGNSLDDRAGTYYDVTITNITSADEDILRPYQENGNWFIEGIAPGDTEITYTFTGGPKGAAADTHTVTLGVRDNTYWPDLVDENGEHVEYAEKIIGETGKIEPLIWHLFLENGVKKEEQVPLSHAKIRYYYDERVISLDESTGAYTARNTGETDVRLEVDLYDGEPEVSDHIVSFSRYVRIRVETVRYDLTVPDDALFWAAPGEFYDAADFALKTGAKLMRYSMREPQGVAVPAVEYAFVDEDMDEAITLAGETVDGRFRSGIEIAADALDSGADADGMKTLEDAVVLAANAEDGTWSARGASVKLHTHAYGDWTVTRQASGSVKEEKTRTCIHGNCGHEDHMEKPTIKLSTNSISMTRTTDKPTPSLTVTVTLEPGDAITTVGVKLLNGTNKDMLYTVVSGNKVQIKTDKTKYLAGSAKLTVYTKYSKLYGGITGNREITVNVMKSLTAPPTGAISVASVAAKVYSGKEYTPAPAVKVGKTTLKLGTDYKIDYKDNKAVGRATLAVKGLGVWKGTIVKYFTINPKPTKITSLTAGTKQFKAVWTKIGTQTTGYQLQYSTSSTFKSGNTVKTISSPATVSLTVKNLTAKKVYYVRIRTFKKINANGVAYLSAWSPVVKVTTK